MDTPVVSRTFGSRRGFDLLGKERALTHGGTT